MKDSRFSSLLAWLPAAMFAIAGAAVLAVIMTDAREVASAQTVPGIPHGVAGQERCLLCHAAGAVKPVPGTHQGYPEATCQGCHQPAARPAPGGPPPAPAAAPDCQTCHGQPGLSFRLPSGEELPLFVDSQRYGQSVHGANFACTSCHDQISAFPHPPVAAKTQRKYTLGQGEVCQQCHAREYAGTRDSVHTRLLAEGRKEALVCSDCHGSHYIQSKVSKSDISKTCSGCHREVFGSYIQSVHGKALVEEGAKDVPVCTDCHKSHDISDPRTLTFHYQSVDICATCHSDREIAAKYGLSPDVVKTYLQDFHGAAVTLRRRELQTGAAAPQTFVPVCTDCHGVHDILSIKDPESPAFKANLVKTCRKCHEEAGENFPAAWLSHYEPSWDRARLIFIVKMFYRVFIPFVVIGLVLHIAVDLWRTVRKR